MKKTLMILLVAVVLLALAASSAFAGGDKVRGDNGAGQVSQVQVMDPPPFQP